MDGNRLVKVMQEIAKNSTTGGVDLVFGQVLSLSPLQIKVDNRFIIDDKFLILSKLCYSKSVSFTLNGEDVIINLWRGLEVNDKVRMLRVHSGQLFYVLEREGSDL